MLIELGLDIHRLDIDGLSALHCALAGGFWSVVDVLVKKGAVLKLSEGFNIYQVAGSQANRRILHYCEKLDLNFKENLVRCLISSCGDPHVSPEVQRDYIIYLLDEMKLDINVKLKDHMDTAYGIIYKGATALIAAASVDSYDICSLLVVRGADVLQCDSKGNIALHYCCGQVWQGGDGVISWRAFAQNISVIELLATPEAVVKFNAKSKSPYMLATLDNQSALPVLNSILSEAGVSTPILLNSNLNGLVESVIDSNKSYKLNFRDGQFEGEQLFYKGNMEQPFATISYRGGQPHGKYEVWYSSGQKMLSGHLKDGIPIGDIFIFSKDGNSTKHLKYDGDGKLHGQQTVINNPNEIVIDAMYSHGKAHGKVYFKNVDEDKVKIDSIYESGKPKKNEDDSEGAKESQRSGGLLGALLGVFNSDSFKNGVALVTMEKALDIDDTLIFHKPDKLREYFEKTQMSKIHC